MDPQKQESSASTVSSRPERLSNAHRAKIKSYVGVLVVIILGLILRIPRVSGLVGADAFRVLWMGQLVAEGYFVNWFVSPFSLIGFYPFVSYPIGGPLLVGLLLRLGYSLEATVLIISAIVTIVATIGAYKLGRDLLNDETSILLFTACYSLSDIFVRFTYYSLSVRGLYLAVLPWLLLYSVRLIRKRRFKDGFIALSLLSLLFFTHPLAVYTLLYLLAVGLWYLIDYLHRHVRSSIHVDSIPMLKRFTSLSSITFESRAARHLYELIPALLYTVTALISVILGVILLGVDVRKTAEFLITNDTMFGILFNLAVDYFLRVGLISIFIPLGAISAFHSARNFKGKLLHFIVTVMVCFSLAMSLYASVIFLPVFAYYAVVGISLLWRSIYRKHILLLTLTLALIVSIAYPAFLEITSLESILMSAILAVILTVAIIPNNLYPKILDIKSKYVYILLISMVVITAMSIDGPINYNPYSYMSNDEKAIILYLDENSEGGLTFVYKPEVGARLEAYGYMSIRSYNEDKSLYMNWITPQEIRRNTEIDLSIERIFTTGRIFYYTKNQPEKILWNTLTNLDLRVVSNFNDAKELGLRYVIVEKSVDGWQSYFRSTYGDVFSILLYTTPYACTLVFDGSRMSLFALP